MLFENRRIIQEFRRAVKEAFIKRDELLMNVIDALTVGPRFRTPVELTSSELWQYQWPSLYTGIRNGKGEQSLDKLRRRRIDWLEQYRNEVSEPLAGTGNWQIRVLDATNYDRPKTETVKLVYAHGVNGFKPGHCLSLLSECAAAGSWCLPLEIKLVPAGKLAREFGPEQLVDFASEHPWRADQVLAVDADYTKATVLRPMYEAGINVLGRVSSKRKFYLPPPSYGGRGRPCVRGRKLKLNDARTLPEPDENQRVELAAGRSCEVSRWSDVRMFAWPEQPLALYRVVEYRADGSLRYKRPLWLIYMPAQGVAPTLSEARAIYECRFSVEHSLRFMKGELLLDGGQFNGTDALERIALWVELAATALWQLFALKISAQSDLQKLPRWWCKKKPTPRAVRMLALGIFVRLAITPAMPKPRGKSSGRKAGSHFEPRKRYRIFRRRKRRALNLVN